MRELSAEAIVLDTIDLHERDRIVVFLTAEGGTKRGVAQGARGKFSRFAGRLQPLSTIAVRWFEKEERELVRIREASIVRSADGLQRRLEPLMVASYLAEQAAVMAPENEYSGPLYRLLSASVGLLLDGADPDPVARYFEVWALRLGGLFPSVTVCSECGRPFDREGAVLVAAESLTCASCQREARAQGSAAAGLRLSAEGLTALGQVFALAPARVVGDAVLTANRLRELERVAAEIRRAFLGRELRSYEVMKRTLQT